MSHLTRLSKPAALATALMAVSPAAPAADFWATVGIKAWETDWSSWRINNVYFETGGIQVSEPLNSSTKTTETPQLTLGYKSLSISGSYLLPQTYTLSGAQDFLTAKRKELDTNARWDIFPGFGVTAGYKQITQQYGSAATFTWSGPTVGLSGLAPIRSTQWAVYGLYGQGFMHLSLSAGAQPDASGSRHFPASYSLVEAGLSYAFPSSAGIAVRINAGYRAQIITTKSFQVAQLTGYTAPNERDYTEGPALSLSATF